jgi:hypothetical protein
VRFIRIVLALCALSIVAQPVWASPLTTAFSYQGRLDESGAPANGSYDFRFRLYDASVGGSQVGPILYHTTIVQDGLFTVGLDFGDVYDGERLWLQIDVRPTGSGAYTPLSPRQELTATPHACYALRAGELALPFAGTVNTTGPAFDVNNQGSSSSDYAIRGVRGTAGNLPGNHPVIMGSSSTENIGVAGTGYRWGVAGFVDTDYATGVQGEVTSGVTGAEAVAAVNFASGNDAYLGTDDYAGEFYDDVYVYGTIQKRYAAGTSDPAIPIAYGFINTDGSVSVATPNVSSSYNAGSGRYEITIAGESYYFSEYVTVVTVVGTPALLPVTSSVGGDLLVYLRDVSGNSAQRWFQFVTYKPTGAGFTVGGPRATPTPERPHITDTDVWEQLGVQQLQQRTPAEEELPRKARSAAFPEQQ